MHWVSEIELSKEREENIEDYFPNQEVNFAYPANVEDFKNDLGENMILDKLIVMDDVSIFANKSDEFANFLTVFRKYGITCVYIFHTIYPNWQNWQMILSQTQIFFFPGSAQSSLIIKILSTFANRYKNTYVPTRNIWINRLYYNISTSRQRQCLTIDTRDVNELGRGKFRTQADNDTEQICSYNRNKSDISFNSFLAAREETSQTDAIKFSIVKVIDNTNRTNVIYSKLSDELSNLKNDDIQSRISRTSERDSFRQEPNKKRNDQRREYTGHGRVSKNPRLLS